MEYQKTAFSKRLIELRKEFGISPAQLAKRINFGKSIIYYWENGQREPNSQALIALSKFFNVSIEYLLGIDDDTEKSSTLANTQTSNEKRLLRAFVQLDNAEQIKIIEQCEFFTLLERNHKGY